MTSQSVKVPKDRIGALIGKEGEVKSKVEKLTGVRMAIDSAEGDVELDYSKASDPSSVLSVMDFVTAVGRGFSPEKALMVLDDDWYLEVIDIREYVGKKPNHVARMRARVIGTKGKTRKLFEVCRINGSWAYRIRPFNLLTGAGGHGDEILEIACAQELPGIAEGAEVTIQLFR